MRQAAVLALLSLWLTAGPVSAPAEAPAPYHLIRALQSEQDELVRGGGTPPAQGKLLAQISRAFEGTPIEAWRDPKNGAAAAIFLFSGGSSAAVRKLLAMGAFAEADTPLLRGAAAYADGREGEARAHLLPIGPEEIRPSVGGHLALVQATLIGRRDPPKAMERLDWARLLMPGTIVEETALRRQIFLTADARDFAKLLALAERYRRRFPASAYAAAFQPKLVEIVLDAALTSDPESLDGLDAALRALPAAERRAAVLSLARTALLRGKLRLARLAAEAAARLAEAGSADATRADLYWAAAAIVPSDHAAALAKAESLSPASLDPADRELLQAVLALGRTLRAWPKPEAAAGLQTAAANLSPSARATLDRASAALAEAGKALKGEGR